MDEIAFSLAQFYNEFMRSIGAIYLIVYEPSEMYSLGYSLFGGLVLLSLFILGSLSENSKK
jgi:hypothetical protein